MIKIDGSLGEGGGQILRTALGLSLVTGESFQIEKIRAGRSKPGLLRQHLTAVEAAAKISNARVEGANAGSQSLLFEPGKVMPGDYHFAVGTAGSSCLVLQTVLPALLLGSKASTLLLEGGTHNPFAPPFDYLQKVFFPLINRMGPCITAHLERAGFYPAGGGRWTVTIEPASKLGTLELMERGEIIGRRGRAMISNLSRRVAERELQIVSEKLGWDKECLRVEEVHSPGPGNALILEIESESNMEMLTGFGERGVQSEAIAGKVVDEARDYLAVGAPVGEHLADQLMLPMAMAGSGCFRTRSLSRHATTNIEVIRQFLSVSIQTREDNGNCMVQVG